jgi:SSS family solute:Na+ symporter
VVVSLVTKPKPVEELDGLVWGCTKLPSERVLPLYQRPVFWGAGALIVFAILQWLFW